MLQNRSVATVVILSIVTCGIYSIYWAYVTIMALDNEGQSSNMSPLVQFILVLLLGSIGYILFGLNADANLNAIKEKRGLPTSDNKVIYIVLGFLIPIVLIGMVQSEINNLADM